MAMMQFAGYIAWLLLVVLSARTAWDTRASNRAMVVSTFAARMGLPLTPEISAIVLARLVRRARAGAVGGACAIVIIALAAAFVSSEVAQTLLPWLLPSSAVVGVSIGWAVAAISSTSLRPADEVRVARLETPELTDFVSPVTRRILAIATLSAPVIWAICAALVSVAPGASTPWTLPIVVYALPCVVAVGVVAVAAERLALRAATIPRRVANTLELKWEDALRTDIILVILTMPATLAVGSGVVSLMSIISSRLWRGEDVVASTLPNLLLGLMAAGWVALIIYAVVTQPQRRFHATLWSPSEETRMP